MELNADRVVLKTSIWKHMLGVIFFGLGGWVLVIAAEHQSRAFAEYKYWALALICAVFVLLGLRQLFDRRDTIIIDRLGIFDRRVMDRPIPWRNIAAISEGTMRRGARFIVLHVKDARQYATGLKRVRGWWGPDRIAISGGLTIGLSKVKSAMDEFYNTADPTSF